MRHAILVVCLALAAGCASTDGADDPRVEKALTELAHDNQANLVNLNVGMKKTEVIKIMGRNSAHTRDGKIANPFKIETFQDKQGRTYEVLYYVTERNRRFQPLRLGNTTPLVFREGALVGWGPDALRSARTAGR
jgi:hypothetical protein